MELINQKVEEITPSDWSLEGIQKFAEKCGRTCYASSDLITDTSYEKFCNMIKNRGHMSVFGHATVYCKISSDKYYEIVDDHNFKWFDNPFQVDTYNDGFIYLSTSLRAIYEHHLEDLLEYITPNPEFEVKDGIWIKHVPRRTFKVTCSISVSRELNRHGVSLSICEQSTRYCNFSKDKFGNELTFVIPHWSNLEPGKYDLRQQDKKWNKVLYKNDQPMMGGLNITDDILLHSNSQDERNYFRLLNAHLKPEESREVLPLGLATEVVYTAWEDHYLNWDWKHVLDMRSPLKGAKGVHPMCAEIANEIYKSIFKENE